MRRVEDVRDRWLRTPKSEVLQKERVQRKGGKDGPTTLWGCTEKHRDTPGRFGSPRRRILGQVTWRKTDVSESTRARVRESGCGPESEGRPRLRSTRRARCEVRRRWDSTVVTHRRPGTEDGFPSFHLLGPCVSRGLGVSAWTVQRWGYRLRNRVPCPTQRPEGVLRGREHPSPLV